MNFFYFILVISFNFSVYFLFYQYIQKTGGWKSNLIIFIFIVFLFHFTFIVPLYFFFSGRTHIWDNNEFLVGFGPDISDYYLYGFLVYGLGTLFLLFGYLVRIPKLKYIFSNKTISEGKVVLFFYIFYFLIIFNFLVSGINPLSTLINGSDNTIIGQETFSNYLRNFADSLISLLIIAYAYKISSKKFYLMIILSFILFILMGFRYRIILSLLGFLFVYLLEGKMISFRSIINFSFFFLFILFITSNRYEFAKGNFDNPIENFRKSNVDLIFEQTRSSLPDLAVFKYIDKNVNSEISYDYGLTFLYTFIRFLPRSIFGDLKDLLYPPPAFIVIDRAYALPNHFGSLGETPTLFAYFYIAFGIIGVCFLSFLLGFVIKFFKMKTDYSSSGVILQIIFGVSLFQFVSRGYFPQYMDTLLFMILPLFLFNKKLNILW
ncbi:oligosaccharide repeat unit polymerase [Algoriphagus ornithinivorans]|uniref:Oligosaccharide repeat unit polymerase n=1 Tax=Algoriphagus ornithinivorans TaxID=226506 RepID=A0A1I5JN82_9BACT|nr:O-antigen polymerase [Algoriphagus ornithinivorans]SFO74195.1 oligosaccharide repeat unit polymerase [Algoriphagus ornithinivorans]